MTAEQKQLVKNLGLDLKKILLDFTGSVTYHFSCNKTDVKVEIKEYETAKQE